MPQNELAPEPIVRLYVVFLQHVILNLRMRIRYGENVDLNEVHDILDAVHNIPELICDYGGWHDETNIKAELDRYDQKWQASPDHEGRASMTRLLQRATAFLDRN